MLQIYIGNGKGKTTAAAGAVLRAAGEGAEVIFSQFLKDGRSGETAVLAETEHVRVLLQDCFYGFVSGMTEEERAETASSCRRLFRKTEELAHALSGKAGGGEGIRLLVVMDEILHALKYGFLDTEEVLSAVQGFPGGVEVILTGRKAPPDLLAAADYITEFRKVRHPLDSGTAARKGVEF